MSYSQLHLSCNSRVINLETNHRDLSIYQSYMVDGIPYLNCMDYTLQQIWSMEYHPSTAHGILSTRYIQWIPDIHDMDLTIHPIWSIDFRTSLCRICYPSNMVNGHQTSTAVSTLSIRYGKCISNLHCVDLTKVISTRYGQRNSTPPLIALKS